MTLRLDTTLANVESDVWSPTGETLFVQVESANYKAKISALSRVHADAPWCRVHAFEGGKEGLIRIEAPPLCKIAVVGNTAGKRIRAWE